MAEGSTFSILCAKWGDIRSSDDPAVKWDTQTTTDASGCRLTVF
jgi:hypothetical protein